MIRLAIPTIEDDDLNAACEALKSGFLVQGQRVAKFENAVAAQVGTRYPIAVSSCTAALHLALVALGASSGDLVIVPSYSFTATANVVELCGAQSVFVDIRPDTFNMDPSHLSDILKRLMGNADTRGRVRAVMPVHAFGQIADMPEILESAAMWNIPVIEDAACALGAALDGRQAGAWGTLGCFSFHPRKAVTTGEGGMITTNDVILARRLKALRNHGLDPDSDGPEFMMPGFNYRLTEFQAALGSVQMSKLNRILAARRRLAGQYDALLSSTFIQPPRIRPGSEPAFQSYVVLIPEFAAPRRSDVLRFMKERGIETSIGTWHIPLTRYYSNRYGYGPGDFPVADQVFARSVALPLYEHLSFDDQAYVISQLTAVLLEIERS
jgi:perosamine synthetase